MALQSIWRTSGLPGFYRGSSVTLARDILWNGLSYGFFVNWKALFAKIYKRECTPTENAIIGALGGSMAALLTQVHNPAPL